MRAYLCSYAVEGACYHLSPSSHCSLFEGLCSEEVHIFQKCWKPFPSLPSLQVVALSQQESQKVLSSILSDCQWKLKHKLEFTRQFFFYVSCFPLHFLFIVMFHLTMFVIYNACIHKSSVYFQCRMFIYLVVVQNKAKRWVVNLLSSPPDSKHGFSLLLSHDSLSDLCRAAHRFSVVFHSVADGLLLFAQLLVLSCAVFSSTSLYFISSQNMHV